MRIFLNCWRVLVACVGPTKLILLLACVGGACTPVQFRAVRAVPCSEQFRAVRAVPCGICWNVESGRHCSHVVQYSFCLGLGIRFFTQVSSFVL